MKIFLTGGNGMVGKNISSLAIAQGHEVFSPGRLQLDLQRQGELTAFIQKHRPDIVIHCAGLVGGIKANIASPYDYCMQNLQIGLNVIQESYEAGVNKLINLSSSCMYPHAALNPLKEEYILSGELEPTNEGYALAKIAVARLVNYLSKQKAVDYKNYISCNLYGYWDKFITDDSHLVPAVIHKLDKAVKEQRETADIWGDGHSRREFMFAEDLADFILFSLNDYDKVPANINVGTGIDYTINEYYNQIAKLVNFEGEFIHDLSMPSGMKRKVLDITKQTELCWAPKTDLETGLYKTYQFYINEVL